MSESAAGGPTTFRPRRNADRHRRHRHADRYSRRRRSRKVCAQANERLAGSRVSGVALADGDERSRLIELYLDRATEAHHALAALATTVPATLRHWRRRSNSGRGGLPRPSGVGLSRRRIRLHHGERRGERQGRAVIEFTLDTQRARSEVRGQATQLKLVDELVRVGADDKNRNTQIGRSLFQLLVPFELEPFLSGASLRLAATRFAPRRHIRGNCSTRGATRRSSQERCPAMGRANAHAAQAANGGFSQQPRGCAQRRRRAGDRRAAVRPAEISAAAGRRRRSAAVAEVLGDGGAAEPGRTRRSSTLHSSDHTG